MPLSPPRDSERRDLRSLDEVVAVFEGLNHARAGRPPRADATESAAADAESTESAAADADATESADADSVTDAEAATDADSVANADAVADADAAADADADADAATDAAAAGHTGSRLIVGIAGSPGSGKSTLGSLLVDRLNAAASAAASTSTSTSTSTSSAAQPPRDARAVLLPMDGFHLPQSRLVELGRRDRMGAPDTFDVAGFITTLRALRTAGQAAGDAGNKDKDNGNGNGSERGNAPEIPDPVLVPGFDREIEEPVPDAMSIPASAHIVVVEGNYLLMQSGGWQEVVPLLDVSFFVDLERGIRLERLIARHERFGKSPDAARDWALGPDEANARLIEESAARATHRIRLD